MMWSDTCIKQAQRCGKINISPFNEERIQPNSIDLTLDDEILVYDKTFDDFIPFKISNCEEVIIERNGVSISTTDGKVPIDGSGFILASTVEKVSLGNGVCGQVDGKSSYGRKGLQIHQTAGFIDAGFSGNITLEMCTVGQPIRLEVGMPICQLVFWDAYPSEKVYGSEGLGSHYQGQTGVTKSWI